MVRQSWRIVFFCAGALLGGIGAVAYAAAPVVELPKASQVRLSGLLGERLRGNADYLLALLDPHHPLFHANVAHGEAELLDCFRPDYVPPHHAPDRGLNRPIWAQIQTGSNQAKSIQGYWMGDYAGKWLEAASLTASSLQHKELARRAAAFAERLMAGQAPDGRICFTIDDDDLTTISPERKITTFLAWNTWMAMTGLLARHEETGDKAALETARRAAGWLMKYYDPPERLVSGYFYGGLKVCGSDQMIRLFWLTGDNMLLDYMRRVSPAYAAGDPMRRLGEAAGSIHFYTQCACLESAVVTACAAGDTGELRRLERIWETMTNDYTSPFGAPGSPSVEFVIWDTKPRDFAAHRLETCAIMQWMSLTRRLYQATGRARYVDALERAVYNALLGAQSTDGLKWQYVSSFGKAPKGWFNGTTSCCYYSGTRALATLPWLVYATDQEGVIVNLFEGGQAALACGGKPVLLKQETDYPAEGRTTITVESAQPVECALKLRIPAWAANATARVNGGDPLAGKPGEYLAIRRTWNRGDRVELEFGLPVRVAEIWNAPAGAAGRKKFSVLLRGAQVLALDAKDNPDFGLKTAVSLSGKPELGTPRIQGHSFTIRGTVLADGQSRPAAFVPYADAGQTSWSQCQF